MKDDNVVALAKPAEADDPLTELLRQGARHLIQQAVEAELSVLLNQHVGRVNDQGCAAVVRNGYHPERQVVTGIGPVTVKIPKVRSRTDEPIVFRSALVPPYIRRTRSLDAALPWLYLKGIATGQMKEALQVLVGTEAKGLSASVVSRLKRQWQDEYAQWSHRRLDRDRWVYLWVDGIYSGLRADAQKRCALVIIGVNERGQKHFLAIEDGIRESTQSWREVLLGLKARGMNAPQLAIGDGALGFWAALDEVYPTTHRQRCWVHKTANVLNYLPKAIQPKAKGALQEIWMAESRHHAEKAFGLFMETYGAKYPKAVNCLSKDRDQLLSFYDFPAQHWQHIRTTNPIESTFATIRHRTDRTKGCVTRDTLLTMIYKLGCCAEKRWRRLRGFEYLAKLIRGVKFKDGIEIVEESENSKVAA